MQTTMETEKGLPALRAKPEPTEADLRQNLAAAIEARRLADAKAAKIKSGLEKCAAMLSASESEVSGLEAKIAKAERRASERDAAGIVAAIKAGAPIPMTAMPEISTAELDCAKVKAATIRAAHAQFQSEWQEAAAAVSAASDAVAAAADAILLFEAKHLAAKRTALEVMCWEVDDALHGLFRLDRQRKDGPRLEKIEFELGKQLDRRGLAIAQDKRLIEQPGYLDYIARLQAGQEGRWAAYRLALMDDAGAQFEPPSGPVEQ